jgi:hypothetical protein
MREIGRPVRVEDYIRRNSKNVEGWMTHEAARLIRVVSDEQISAGIRGSVGEIGVHHGRLFILLYLLARPNERGFAIDIFEKQELNVDNSGKGDRKLFEANLRGVGADLTMIDIICASSLDVSPQRIEELSGPVRLFSIDGGHTSTITLNDLRLAEATLVDGGVVMLDDVFTSTFPGVAAGLATYLLGEGRLVPFAITPDKVLMTQPEHHCRLMAAVALGMSDLAVRNESYFDCEVIVMRSAPTARESFRLNVAQMTAYRRLRQLRATGFLIEHMRPMVLKAIGR